MVAWLDETGSDKRKETGWKVTAVDFKLTVQGQCLSSVAIVSTRGIENLDIHKGNISVDIFCFESL